MAKYPLLVGELSNFETVVEINEELQALLIPLLTAVENEAQTDTHLMLRTLQRLVFSQIKSLDELGEILK
ncbi:hypothetical protein [Morganella morganii]|uniref:hypothetical protein n=1 Tax=Morganella morganii TaxID=582 RepID=UPI00042762A6|nr:hypothetical protein [Morganella morganii]EKU4305120.1 hypothetical protein [Morganella morganii]HAT3765926.1 hypothetical protein [Morganella morganii]HBC7441669.1 hypothetical protein [Morganella morganii]HBN5914265.1 hypothetical protein [Morganella morganii]